MWPWNGLTNDYKVVKLKYLKGFIMSVAYGYMLDET